MDTKALYQESLDKIERDYIKRRPKSEKMNKDAQSYLPGGDTRSTAFYRPFPTCMEHGEGCRLYDVDGNAYIDFGNNATSLIHGHAHPKIVEAVIGQVKRGSVFAAPEEHQFKLGKIICDRIPSVDKVRFCNSGTEATMGAIRIARAYRKKYKLVKLEGGYHGSHDIVGISVKPPLDKAGPADRPNCVPEDISIPPNVVKDCIVIPFNRADAAERVITENQADLAGVILEPMQGSCGMIPADPAYIQTIRHVTAKYRIPLIFDEVFTFRLAPGGWQEMHNILPDITALGKIIGGGYPVGAVAGREEFVNLFSPLNPGYLSHSGTFNGNPVTMVAGCAALELLTASEIDRINALGGKLRSTITKVLQEVGIISQVTGMGSLTQIHFTKEKVIDWRSASTGRLDLRTMLQLLLLGRGIFPAARMMLNVSTPMRENEIEELGKVLKSSLIEMKPYIEKAAPELIV